MSFIKLLEFIKEDSFENSDSQEEWEDSLTAEEMAAFKYYSATMETSDEVRKMEGIHGKAFYQAIDRAPNYSGIIYRGQYLENSQMIDSMTEVGAVFEFGFQGKSSAGSKSSEIAEEFIDDSWKAAISAKFKIKISSGVDISKLVAEEYARQEEVIIRKGTKFKVITAKWVRTSTGRRWDVLVEET